MGRGYQSRLTARPVSSCTVTTAGPISGPSTRWRILENSFVDKRVRLIICGDRHYRNYRLIETVVRSLHVSPGIELLIEGECPYGGADTMGRNAAVLLKIPLLRMPADWNTYGRAAGPIRNREMRRELLKWPGKKMCLGFHTNIAGSVGTRDMLDLCRVVDAVETRLYYGDSAVSQYKIFWTHITRFRKEN